MTPKTNPHRVGDVVTMVLGNAVGEGILWQVTKTKNLDIWITPILTLTGPSIRRPCKVRYYQVDVPDLILLAGTYAQLGNLIADIARSRAQ